MTVRVAINGYGRIGRSVLRVLYECLALGRHKSIQVVAVNDPGTRESLVHLTRYDTIHGPFQMDVALDGEVMVVGGDRIRMLQEPDPADCPWGELEIDVVLECSGLFRTRSDAMKHLEAGAGRVVIGAVAFDKVDNTIVYGVNHQGMTAKDKVISSASCTTHCVAPLLGLLNGYIGIRQVFMTEIHPYTSDQQLLDHAHRDLRRARAAAQNLIPTTSSCIGAVQQVLPEIAGRIDGYSMRVPTINVAAVDLTVTLERPVSVQSVHHLMDEASAGDYKGLIGICEEPLVSSDFVRRSESAVYDATLTRVLGEQLKIVAWYDNEWGYAHRLLDLVEYMTVQPA